MGRASPQAIPATSASRPIVVSGFDSLSGRGENSSRVLGRAMAVGQPDTAYVELPVLWGEPERQLSAWPSPPRAWLALGEAGKSFRLEAIASNHRVAMPDNDGRLPPTPEVRPGCPPLLCPSPLAELAALLSLAGYPVGISEKAGGYLCDELFYQLLARQAGPWPGTLVFFLHVPTLGYPVPSASPDEATPTGVVDEAYLAGFGQVMMRALRWMVRNPMAPAEISAS